MQWHLCLAARVQQRDGAGGHRASPQPARSGRVPPPPASLAKLRLGGGPRERPGRPARGPGASASPGLQPASGRGCRGGGRPSEEHPGMQSMRRLPVPAAAPPTWGPGGGEAASLSAGPGKATRDGASPSPTPNISKRRPARSQHAQAPLAEMTAPRRLFSFHDSAAARKPRLGSSTSCQPSPSFNAQGKGSTQVKR